MLGIREEWVGQIIQAAAEGDTDFIEMLIDGCLPVENEVMYELLRVAAKYDQLCVFFWYYDVYLQEVSPKQTDMAHKVFKDGLIESKRIIQAMKDKFF